MPAKRCAAVVFIHGLAKKPPAVELIKLWQWALARDNPNPGAFAPPNKGLDLSTNGVPHELNYWADVFYGEDTESDFSSYYEANQDLELASEGLAGADAQTALPPPRSAEGARFVAAVQAKLAAHAALLPSAPPQAPVRATVAGADLEIAAWLPEPVKAAIIKKAAMEAYYYLFDDEFTRADGKRLQVRQVLRQRLIDQLLALQAQAERLVIVAHSMGTMIAYDVLRRCPDCPPVHTLITIGSPLGVTEVQEKLVADGAKGVDFPAARLQHWINIYDPLDPVCGADPRLANDFAAVDGKQVRDLRESNWGNWRHTVTHYLAGPQLRAALAAACA
jgi:hypothetical protein